MFESAERDPVMSKDDFAAREGALRTALLQRQYALLEKADRTVLLVVAGIDGAGKGSTVNQLNEWMDPRNIHTLAFGTETPESAQRPPLWQYWNALPPKGQLGIVFDSWYAPLMAEASSKHPDPDAIAFLAAEIQRFEALLAADGVQIVKLWYHLSRDAQAGRIRKQLADPATAWRVSKADRLVHKRYDRLRKAGETVIAATQSPHAPWQVVPGADDRMRMVTTATALLDAFNRKLPKVVPLPAEVGAPAFVLRSPHASMPAAMLPTAPMSPEAYEVRMDAAQARLGQLVRHKAFKDRSLVLVFEGIDAAGKGGAIRRITHALDARQYSVMPVSAPTDMEKAHPYLWRFWNRLPTHGRVAIFDRSWYGRVLVERVEKLIGPEVWRRAYDEINDFESQLQESGAVVIKFWLAVSQEEQLRRFNERAETPFKRFKLTPDDWRNRDKWEDYRKAADAMFERTDTLGAPWHVVATDDKRQARVQVIEAVTNGLAKALGKRGL